MLDNCTLYFGTLVENMLLERDEVGSGATKESVPRYTLPQLLDPDFVWPKPPDELEEIKGIAGAEGIFYDEV